MTTTPTTIARAWTDDYLDLLNYARRIGDQIWYDELLSRLQDRDRHIEREAQFSKREHLWSSFDEINRRMLDLYKQIHISQESMKQRLRDQLFELRAERVRISLALRKG